MHAPFPPSPQAMLSEERARLSEAAAAMQRSEAEAALRKEELCMQAVPPHTPPLHGREDLRPQRDQEACVEEQLQGSQVSSH